MTHNLQIHSPRTFLGAVQWRRRLIVLLFAIQLLVLLDSSVLGRNLHHGQSLPFGIRSISRGGGIFGGWKTDNDNPAGVNNATTSRIDPKKDQPQIRTSSNSQQSQHIIPPPPPPPQGKTGTSTTVGQSSTTSTTIPHPPPELDQQQVPAELSTWQVEPKVLVNNGDPSKNVITTTQSIPSEDYVDPIRQQQQPWIPQQQQPPQEQSYQQQPEFLQQQEYQQQDPQQQQLYSQHQQQQYDSGYYYNPNYGNYNQQTQEDVQYILQTLQQDLDVSFQREQELVSQLDNLTISLIALQQREMIHTHQLDLLTEKIIELENEKAVEYNELLEYKANCTEQAFEIAILNGTVEEWRMKCNELIANNKKDQKHIKELKHKLQQASARAEELALLIEEHRLNEVKDKIAIQLEAKKKQKKAKNSGGFFAWLFGWDSNKDDDQEEEADLKELYESARSTLLEALQNERNVVEELETTVTKLRKNNTAVIETLQSRDKIINELNDRVAIFEEDKIVLKAALRQLRKEFKEETVSKQNLVNELVQSQNETERLKNESLALAQTYQKEITKLQTKIHKKDMKIQALEANITVIGLYVEKLEERLAEFAITRRDLKQNTSTSNNVTQEKYDAIKRDRDFYENQYNDIKLERTELRNLIELMSKERAELKKQMNQTATEINKLKASEHALRTAYAKLSIDSTKLQQEKLQLLNQCTTYEANITQQQNEIQRLYCNATNEVSILRDQVNNITSERSHIQNQLRQAEQERQGLQKKISELQNQVKETQENLQKAQLESQKADEARKLVLADNEANVAKFTNEFMTLAAEVKKAEDAWNQEKDDLRSKAQQAEENLKLEEAQLIAQERQKLEDTKRALESTKQAIEKETKIQQEIIKSEEAKIKGEVEKIKADEDKLKAEKLVLAEEWKKFQEEKLAFEELMAKEKSFLESETCKLNDIKATEGSKIAEELQKLEELKRAIDGKQQEDKKKLEEAILAEVAKRVNEKLQAANQTILERTKKVEELQKRLQTESTTAPKINIQKNESAVKVYRSPPPLPPVDTKVLPVPNVTAPKALKPNEAEPKTLKPNQAESSAKSDILFPSNQRGPVIPRPFNATASKKQQVGPIPARPIPIIDGPGGITRQPTTNRSALVQRNQTRPLNQTMIPRNRTRTEKPRKVAFRTIRKTFSKFTGLHGVFTQPSSSSSKNVQVPPPKQQQGQRIRPPPEKIHPPVRLSPTNRSLVNESATGRVPNHAQNLLNVRRTNSTSNRIVPKPTAPVATTDSSLSQNATNGTKIAGNDTAILNRTAPVYLKRVSTTNRTTPIIQNRTGPIFQNRSAPTRSNRTNMPPQNRTQLNRNPPLQKQQITRKVPLRKLRKLFSKATGVHGAFTKPSSKELPVNKKRTQQAQQKEHPGNQKIPGPPKKRPEKRPENYVVQQNAVQQNNEPRPFNRRVIEDPSTKQKEIMSEPRPFTRQIAQGQSDVRKDIGQQRNEPKPFNRQVVKDPSVQMKPTEQQTNDVQTPFNRQVGQEGPFRPTEPKQSNEPRLFTRQSGPDLLGARKGQQNQQQGLANRAPPPLQSTDIKQGQSGTQYPPNVNNIRKTKSTN